MKILRKKPVHHVGSDESAHGSLHKVLSVRDLTFLGLLQLSAQEVSAVLVRLVSAAVRA